MRESSRLIIGAFVTPTVFAAIVGLALLASVVAPTDDANAAARPASVARMLPPADPKGDCYNGRCVADCSTHLVRAEDDPCWDWSVNGNGYRGMVTRHGRPLVVNACRFARLWRAGNVDYPPSQHMRGDRNAVLNGCR